MSACSSIAVTSDMLAVGTSCGRVCVYKAQTMELVKIAVVSPSATRLNALTSTEATSSRHSLDRLSSTGANSVLAMQFINGCNESSDLFISALIQDGSICVVSVPLSVPDDRGEFGAKRSSDAFVVSSSIVASDHKSFRRIPSDRMGRVGLGHGDESYDFSNKQKKEETEQMSREVDVSPYFCSCVQTEGIFGVVRGDILDVFSVSQGNFVPESPFNQHDQLRVVGSPLVSRVARVRLLDGHCLEPKKGNPRAPKSLHVYDLSIRRHNSRLLISAVGASAKSSLQPLVKLDLWLLIGQIELNAWSKYSGALLVDSAKLQNVAMFRRVSLGLNYHALSFRSAVAAKEHNSNHPHYKYFNSSFCHAFTAHGLAIIDLRRVIEKTDLGRASDQHLPNETRESMLNGQDLLSISSVSIGYLDFSTLCGSDTPSAVPGDNHRSLSDHAVLSFAEPNLNSTDLLSDILDIGKEEFTTLFLSRSLSSNIIMKVQL
jgi:hypothetical protein